MKQKSFIVTGVFLTDTTREVVERHVHAEHADAAIASVHCEALSQRKLFLSAIAQRVSLTKNASARRLASNAGPFSCESCLGVAAACSYPICSYHG